MVTRAMLPRRLDRSGVTMGVTAGVTHNGTRTEGGVYQKQRGVVYHTAIHCIPVVVRVCRPSPSFPNRASGEGQDGSDPPFFAAGAARRRGGWHQVYHLVYHTPTAVGGVAPVLNYPCGKAQPPAQARDWTRRRAARGVTGFSACSSSSAASVPWPRGRGRACAPRPIPAPFWCATTRRMCPRPSSSGTTSRRTWPCNSSADVLSDVPDLVRPDGRQGGAPRAPSPLATFAHVRPPGPRHRRGISPVTLTASPSPDWRIIPARGLSPGVAMFGAVWSGNPSACMPPFRAPALALAGRQSRAARGRARA